MAGCTSWYSHFSASARLMLQQISRRALRVEDLRLAGARAEAVGLGRRSDASSLARDSLPVGPLQTTLTSPGPWPVTAEASERAVGTLPPAGGVTAVSGAGFGQ